MSWFEVIIFVLDLIIGGCVLFYKRSIDELTKTLYAREQEYEKEMGKYDALNDSLQTILQEFEQMKSAVSLEEQRRHNWIESRNQKLINLIRYSEIINIGKARLMTALNNESKSELEKLQADINSTIVNLRVDSITLMGVNPEINDHSVTEFTGKWKPFFDSRTGETWDGNYEYDVYFQKDDGKGGTKPINILSKLLE